MKLFVFAFLVTIALSYDPSKSICRIKVGELASLAGTPTPLNINPSICSLSASEFSEITGYAFDSSSMSSCTWELVYDYEYQNDWYYGRFRTKQWQPTCKIGQDNVVVQVWLQVYIIDGSGSSGYYPNPLIGVYYNAYTHNTTGYYYHYHGVTHLTSTLPLTHTGVYPSHQFDYTLDYATDSSGNTLYTWDFDTPLGFVNGQMGYTLGPMDGYYVNHGSSSWTYISV